MPAGVFLLSSATVNPITVQVATGGADLVLLFGVTAAVLLAGLLILRALLEAYAHEPHVRGTLREEAVRGLSRATLVAAIPLACVFAVSILLKVTAAL